MVARVHNNPLFYAVRRLGQGDRHSGIGLFEEPTLISR